MLNLTNSGCFSFENESKILRLIVCKTLTTNIALTNCRQGY